MPADVAASLLVAGRECGSCSLCCKVMTITYMDPPKAGGKWCSHCSPGKGCAIWQDRPQGCADFHCDWRKNAQLSDDWRPDRCGFVINKAAEHLPFEIIVDPGRPDAWRKEPYYSALKGACRIAAEKRQAMMVLVGPRRWLMLPDKDVAVPTEHYASDYRIFRAPVLQGGEWQVEFVAPARAS